VILVDTSVVIDYIRGKDAKLRAIMPVLAVGLCGIVRAEVLCGTRDPTHRMKLLRYLSLWDAVGDNLAALRTSGYTVPFADAAIATLGIHLGIDVWARDRHYADIQKVLPALNLFQEPP